MPFGLDVSTENQAIAPDLRVEENPVKCLLQALERRFYTDHGSWDADPDFGYNLADICNETGVTADEIKYRFEAECEKDDRVRSCLARVIHSPNTYVYEIYARVDSEAGPFSLVVTVDQVSVQMLASGGINTRPEV